MFHAVNRINLSILRYIITSTKEVLIHDRLFVCLLAGIGKYSTFRVQTKINNKKNLDFSISLLFKKKSYMPWQRDGFPECCSSFCKLG